MTLVAEWDLEPVEPDRPPDFAGVADETLLAAVRRHDRGAFGELWLRHVTAARSCARAMAPAEAVDEIVSEASLACWEATLRGRGPRTDFRAYFLQAVRSRVANRAHRQAPETPMDPDEINTMVGGTNDDDTAAAGDDARVAYAFYSLCPRYRRALLLHEVEGLPMSMVAAELGTTLNAAYQVVFRARNQLRQLFLDFTGDSDVLGPVEPAALPGVVPATELAAKPKPGRVGRAIIGGVIGVGVGTFMAQGKAQAFGGIEQIAAPTGMPVLPVPVAHPWVKAIAGGTSGAVVIAVAALLLGSHAGVADADTPLVSVSPVPPSPTAMPSVVTPLPTPTETQQLGTVIASSTAATVTVTPTPVPATSAPHSQTPTPTKATPPPVPPITVGGVDVGPLGVCYPALTGRAAPGSTLLITKMDGTLLASTTADGSGAWSSGRLSGVRAGTTDIYISDASGGQKDASTSVTVVGVSGLGVSHAPSGLSVWVRGGVVGVPLVVALDGVPVGTIDFDATGEARVVFDVTTTPGAHTVTVYYDASSCRGPGLSVPLQW